MSRLVSPTQYSQHVSICIIKNKKLAYCNELTRQDTSLGFNREPEEVIASDLIASSFPSDVGEGGVNLIFPLVTAFQHVYSG